MGHVKTDFQVDAPPEVCWQLGSDPDRIPEWQEGVIEVKDITGRLDRVGAGYTSVLRIAGRHLDARFEVSEMEKLRLIELIGSAPGGGRATAVTRFEPMAGGTHVYLEVDYELPGGFVGDIADKLFMERSVDRQLQHSNENFKALAEATVPARA